MPRGGRVRGNRDVGEAGEPAPVAGHRDGAVAPRRRGRQR